MKLIFLGAPGAGKGTQAAIVSEKLGIPTISTGDMFRAAMKEGTPVGLRAKAFIEAGQLVPDEVVIDMVSERVARKDCAKGYILDGVPRTIAQAQALEDAGIKFDHVIAIDTPDEVVTARLAGRRVCKDCGATYHMVNQPPKTEGICDKCGGEVILRKDDAPETIANRLVVYHQETEPLVDFYTKRDLVRWVKDEGGVDAINDRIMAILEG